MRPDLNNSPVVVLSNNDGCIISRTPEAKKLGIKMGAPLFKVLDFCNQNKVSIFSSNFSIYTNISNRIMNIIKEESPVVEVYSVDEAFADVQGIHDLENYAKQLRLKILKYVGVPVSIGIGRTKVLAKDANKIAKTSEKAQGVVILDSERLEDVALKRTDVGDIWGVGKQSELKLQNLGIKTAHDFKVYTNKKLIQKLLTKVGLQIQYELAGESGFALDIVSVRKKEIMCSRTFGESTYSIETLKESIANYITNAAMKMRKQESLCIELTLFARTNPFKDGPQFYMYEKIKMANPTSDTCKLIKEAFTLIDKGYRAGYEYKKAGVRLSDFFGTNEFQLDLFEQKSLADESKLMGVIDNINSTLGFDALKSGACGFDKAAWDMKRDYKSPRFFTCWNELQEFK